MTDCLFCKIIDGEMPSEKIYEDDEFYAFLDINPVNKGHTLIIPKEHCRNLLDFPTELETDLMEVSKEVGNAVKEATGADGLTFQMNIEPAAGQEVMHAHFHIIPRSEGDGKVVWRDKEDYDDGELEEYGEEITKYL